MDAIGLLQTLVARGGDVRAVGDRVYIRPSTVLDDNLRAEVRRCKADLLVLLHVDPDPAIAVRVAVMRTQVRGTRPIPFLVFRRPSRPGARTCLSCGEALQGQEYRYRCEPCARAAQIVVADVAVQRLRAGRHRSL